MDENTQNAASPALAGVNPDRLFLASRISLISTSVAFGVISSVLPELRTAFELTATQAGWIGGATLWGFAISIVIFGSLVEALGMGRLMWFAFACHIVGPLMMIFAGGFWVLFIGGLIIALGNGTVQAVGNPLTVTLFPDKIAEKLNKFHMWFPGGIVIGGVLSFILGGMGAGWQAKIVLILIPTIAYGILFIGQKFPITERVQSGITFGQMCQETFLRPLFWVLFIAMGMTATMELGPGAWMGSVMEEAMVVFAGAGAGILVLAYGNLIVALLRYFLAGPLLRIMSPICILALSAIVGGLGLFWLTYVSSPFMIIVAATVFYVGVCYFWPTMIGVGAERIPKGGSLVLALLNGWGMLVVGIVGMPAMGAINDAYTRSYLDDNRAAVIEVLEAAPAALAGDVLAAVSEDEALPVETAVALLAIRDNAEDEALRDQARALINPAEKVGGLWSFRWVAALGIVLVIIFGAIYFQDKARGGPKAEPA